MKITALYVSPGHNYFGHHGKPAGQHAIQSVAAVECLAGRGLAGDRFLDYKPDYAGQVTFFAGEVFEEMVAALSLTGASPAGLRRNVVTRGADLNSLIGQEFTLQGVRFLGTRECSPCYWMDQAFAPGTEAWLKGRGGLRAKILSSGPLRVDAPC